MILKVHGAVDRSERRSFNDSYVISEDHYIDFLATTRLETLVPRGLLVPLLNSALLFLGYRLKDWNLRVILHELWSNRDFGYPAWAVHRDVDDVDAAIWRSRNVDSSTRGSAATSTPSAPGSVTGSGPSERQRPRRASPYLGLSPFDEADADVFFGRRAERDLVIANLLTSRLTVLYGPSGTGKSSLLRAGVLPRVRAGDGVPAVAARGRSCSSTRGRATRCGRSSTRSPPRPAFPDGDDGETLDDALARSGEQAGGILLLVLDQFEEYFLYHSGEDDRLRRELLPAIARPDLRARVLISLREDALASLDLLEGTASSQFGNLVRLGPMTDAAAVEAITKPVAGGETTLEPGPARARPRAAARARAQRRRAPAASGSAAGRASSRPTSSS